MSSKLRNVIQRAQGKEEEMMTKQAVSKMEWRFGGGPLGDRMEIG